jgi:hypothetical protein
VPLGSSDVSSESLDPLEPERSLAVVVTSSDPEPDVPEPDVPEPDVPEPDVPEPDVPEPEDNPWSPPSLLPLPLEPPSLELLEGPLDPDDPPPSLEPEWSPEPELSPDPEWSPDPEPELSPEPEWPSPDVPPPW